MIPDSEALGYWLRAVEEPVGLALKTDHRRNLINRLYNIRIEYRKGGGAEDLSEFVIAYGDDNHPDEVWIIRRECHKLETSAIKPMSEADVESL